MKTVAVHVAEAMHALRSYSVHYIKLFGSGGQVGDGLTLSPPAFLRSSALLGFEKPTLWSFPSLF